MAKSVNFAAYEQKARLEQADPVSGHYETNFYS
jgi:hypothetical protein